MKKKIVLLGLVGLIFCSFYFLNKKATAPGSDNASSGRSKDSTIPAEDLSHYTIDVSESIYVIVNKQRPIPITYTPANLVRPDVQLVPDDNPEEQQLRSEAATSAEEMFNSAKQAGVDLVMASGYRSASLQRTIYDSYVARDGQEAASKYSARPGTSEHQTGLALDITTKNRECYLDICFANTSEGKWLEQNAHKYGFILRYKKDKEDITGYQFEPWHFRYVGDDLAERLFDSRQTMEEFFGLSS